MSSLVVTPGDTDRGAVTNFGSWNDCTNGLKMVDGAADAANAFANGDWIEGTVNGVSAGLDMIGTILNPLAGVCSMVVNWVIDHCGPVQDWLDQLLGDPVVIEASAATWTNIGTHLSGVAEEFRQVVVADMAGMDGLAVDAYRRFADLEADVLSGLARISHGVSAGTLAAGGLLAGVRDFIVGLFSDLVGRAVDAAAKAVLTLGIAAPACLAGLIDGARRLVTRARQFIEALSRSLDKMADLLAEISPAMEQATKTLATVCREGATMPTEFALSLGKNVAGADD